MRIYYYCLVLLCLSACGKKSQTKQSLEQKPTKTFYKIDLSHDFTGSNDSLLLSDIVENASVVEDKGVTFEKGNVKSLEKELKNLLEDERIVHMLKKESREFITKKYNWDEIVDKTIQLYENEPVKVSAKERKKKVRAAMAEGSEHERA